MIYIQNTLVLLFSLTLSSFAKVSIATSLDDFASIADAIGGDQVESLAMAKSTANPHSAVVAMQTGVVNARSSYNSPISICIHANPQTGTNSRFIIGTAKP